MVEVLKEKVGWYVIKKGDEYFAETIVEQPLSNKLVKIIFRDFSGDVLSLGKDIEWAKDWVLSKNIVDSHL